MGAGGANFVFLEPGVNGLCVGACYSDIKKFFLFVNSSMRLLFFLALISVGLVGLVCPVCLGLAGFELSLIPL